MSFEAPHIDYAGLSPVIALTAGVCVVLLSAVLGRSSGDGRGLSRVPTQTSTALTLLTLAATAGLLICGGTTRRTWSPGRCGSTTWLSRSR